VKVAGEFRSGPVFDRGVIVAGSLDGCLHAVRNGTVLGSTDLGNPVIAPVAVADGTVYAATDNGLILAARIGAAAPEVLWRVDLAASVASPVRVRTPPTVVGHRVLVVSEDGVIFLLAR
jgi:outer membrane protein assembly factor BamB